MNILINKNEIPLKILEDSNKRYPFIDWFKSLEIKTRAIISRRIGRLRIANRGDWKSVGGNILELRVDYGPGFRVYFVDEIQQGIILIYGGNKKTQKKDIDFSQKLWKENKWKAFGFQRYFT